jgi:hypothetical protein
MEIRLPEKLQNIVAESLAAVGQHHEHWLSPYYRKLIYNALREDDAVEDYDPRVEVFTTAGKFRFWLSVLAAEHVLPMWSEVFPDNELPYELLATAKQTIKGKMSQETAEKLYFKAEQLLQEAGTGDGWLFPYPCPSFAVTAAHKTLAASFSVDYWELIEISDKDEGMYSLDSYTEEAAAFAALAYDTSRRGSEDYYNGQKDIQRNREFWEWWLNEALPQAWQLAQAE